MGVAAERGAGLALGSLPCDAPAMGERKRSVSKRRRAAAAPPAAPVVTLSCPKCGAGVNGAELGESTECPFCGTHLHLPTLSVSDDGARANEGAKPSANGLSPELSPVSEANPVKVVLVVALLVVGLVIGATLMLSRRGQVPTAPTVPAPPSDPGPLIDPANNRAQWRACTSECTTGCRGLVGTQAIQECLTGCKIKCRFVGTDPTCPAHCRERCSAGGSDTARALCEAGCAESCRP